MVETAISFNVFFELKLYIFFLYCDGIYASQYKWGWVSRQTVELGLRGGEKQTCYLEKSGYVS